MDSKIDLSESGIEDSGPEEVLGRGEGVPNSRIVKLEEEAFLESLKQYKHVQPRIGKEIFHKKDRFVKEITRNVFALIAIINSLDFLSFIKVFYNSALTLHLIPCTCAPNLTDPDFYQAELPEFITPETQPPDHDFQGKLSPSPNILNKLVPCKDQCSNTYSHLNYIPNNRVVSHCKCELVSVYSMHAYSGSG
jgi:hypothetical protein